MLNDKKAAIFDLDGTLVDSMGIWKEIDVEYLGKLHLEVPGDLQQDIEGLSFSEVAVYFKKRFGLKESVDFIKNEWNQMAMDKYLHEVPAKEGAVEFVHYLQEEGFKLGVASSNSIQLVNAALEAHGIRSCFSAVLTCCEVKKGKPEPDVYLEVARRLQVEPKDCIVFEDIPVGIMAGKAAGMTTCAIEDEYSVPYWEEKRKLADYYADSYYDILNGTYEELR